MQTSGWPPAAVIVPVDIYSAFLDHYFEFLDWSSGTKVQIDSLQLQVFWSHKGAPLDRLILINPTAGTWHVAPDPDTGAALRIGLGRSSLYQDNVELGVETIVHFEIVESEGIRVLPLHPA